MKKLFLVLAIGTLCFTSCEKDEDIKTVYVDNPAPENCNCGTVTQSTAVFSFGGIYQTCVVGNCGGSWCGMTDERYSGEVCEWEINTADGDPANW